MSSSLMLGLQKGRKVSRIREVYGNPP